MLEFDFICYVEPEQDSQNNIKKFFPQERYKKKGQVKLNKYGSGPFCRIIVPTLKKEGVYILFLDDKPIYVGECQEFSKRWNVGYGNISPRNCFEGGQPTNCRINNLILTSITVNHKMKLLFKESHDRFALEHKLIEELKPEWNLTKGKPSLSKSKRN